MRKILAIIITGLFLIPGAFPDGESASFHKGYTGFQDLEYVPVSRAAIIQYNPDSLIDDLAYLSQVPASVFYQGDTIYTSPVLYYYNPPVNSKEELPVNPYKSLYYFMEDWTKLNPGLKTELINVNPWEIDTSSFGEVNYINHVDPYLMASEIALSNWESSKEAVVAVFSQEDIDAPGQKTSGTIKGTAPINQPVKHEYFTGIKDVGIYPANTHDFTVPEGYTFVEAKMDWGGIYEEITGKSGKDPDLQLFDKQLGQVGASCNWNIFGVGEFIGTYAYNHGPWNATVTYIPTQSISIEPDSFFSAVEYDIDISIFPGFEVEIPTHLPYMSSNIKITIEIEEYFNFGVAVIGPPGSEIDTAGGTRKVELTFGTLGEGPYRISIFSRDGNVGEVNYKISYSWEQKRTEEAGKLLTGASNAAVLASMVNGPLLYTAPGKLHELVSSTLNTLGVETLHVVSLTGSHVDTSEVRSMLQKSLEIIEYNDYWNLHNTIVNFNTNEPHKKTIVISTVDPYSPWHVDLPLPEEDQHGYFIGPSAYAGATHGSPVLMIEDFSELSSAAAWHTHQWTKYGRKKPSVGCMVLTGRQVYEFFDANGLDGEGMETMLTIAGQYDIGASWDRVFPGVAIPGRLFGTPADTAAWVSRNALYPFMIFANPSVSSSPEYITGSESLLVNGRLQISPERVVTAKNVVLNTWPMDIHRFNERASKYWGGMFVTPDGIIPYYSPSDNPIDMDVNANRGRPGMYWPDMTTSEVVPFYAEKGNYENIFSTGFPETMQNLNKGVVMWFELMHGSNRRSGLMGWWSSSNEEPNPWRGYEIYPTQDKSHPNLYNIIRGSTREPDVRVMGTYTGKDRIAPPGRHDGIVIAANQKETTYYTGYDMEPLMDNLYSMGFNAGSCAVSNTYMHLLLIRHGSVFQVMDPWTTSWYFAFAMQTFMRDVVLGYSVGEAYERGLRHVGIQYLNERWWWDQTENIVYFGDPKLYVYMPGAWDEPSPVKSFNIDGRVSFSPSDYPRSVSSTAFLEMSLLLSGYLLLAYVFHCRVNHTGPIGRIKIFKKGLNDDNT